MDKEMWHTEQDHREDIIAAIHCHSWLLCYLFTPVFDLKSSWLLPLIVDSYCSLSSSFSHFQGLLPCLNLASAELLFGAYTE